MKRNASRDKTRLSWVRLLNEDGHNVVGRLFSHANWSEPDNAVGLLE